MATTAVYLLPYQVLGDAPDGPNLGRNLAERVETVLQANLTLGANLTVPGALAVGSGAAVTGSQTISGNLTVNGTISSASASVSSRCLARHRRTTNSTTTAGPEIGVVRIDDVPILAGHLYKISTGGLYVDGSANGGIIACKIRITTDGSTPTTASTAIGFAQIRQDDATVPETIEMMCTYAPVGNETLSVLLTILTAATTAGILGAAINPIELLVEDLGLLPAIAGTDL